MFLHFFLNLKILI